jgi:hypothetical protein
MSRLNALAAVVLLMLGLVCIGCGGGTDNPSPVSHTQTARKTLVVGESPVSSAAVTNLKPFEQDEDDDDGPGEEKGLDPKDSDIDGDNDHLKPGGFYDHDDTAARNYGRAPSSDEKRELTAFVKRYYAAAVVGDGATACSMFVATFAKSVTQEFGRDTAGPSYLRSATTCQEIVTLLFQHLHVQVSVPQQIVRVRVKGNHGLVLLGGVSTPASYLELEREGGAWKSIGTLATPMR